MHSGRYPGTNLAGSWRILLAPHAAAFWPAEAGFKRCGHNIFFLERERLEVQRGRQMGTETISF
jgi:hypothetical protein